MRWWDYVALFAWAGVVIGFAGLVGAWAAERRLDRIQRRELDPGPVLNDQLAKDVAESGSTLKGGQTDG